jgi:HD-GYP domain-containing protein (c-di-GMP phosphodiesterase class II)
VPSVYKCFNRIQKNKGTQFDPEIAEVFLSLFEENERYSSINGYAVTQARESRKDE